MLSQTDMYLNGIGLDDPFLNMALTSSLCAHPVEKIEDLDLSLVKQEPLDTGYHLQHETSSATSHTCAAPAVDVKRELTSPDHVTANTPLPVQRPQKGKRGRKPQVTAYGKVGEKLEKRREQNRRAAATYREKQRRKKLSVEQVAKTYYKLEADNMRKSQENEQLRMELLRLQSQLQAHAHDGTCKKVIKTEPYYGSTANITASQPPSSVFAQAGSFMPNSYLPSAHAPPPTPTSTMTSVAGMGMVAPTTSATHGQDQSLAMSPFTPKTNSDQPMFAFDGFDAMKGMMTSPRSVHSPASVQSVSPRPSSLMSELHYPLAPVAPTGSQSAPSSLDLSFVLNSAQQTLSTQVSQAPIVDVHYHNAVDEFLSEQNC